MSVLEDNAVLSEILSTGSVRIGSESRREGSGIRRSFAEALHSAILRHQPASVLEVGMANGVSTLSILTALQQLGGDGRLTSIDPNQTSDYARIGVRNVAMAGLSSRHSLIEAPDYLALPELLRSGFQVDFAYIDGWHTFDYTLLDFWYVDRMLRPGGIVAFNDCHLRAVHKVCRFVTSHRKYAEVDAGLRSEYRSSNLLRTAVRRATGRNGADRYFRKLAAWEPNWDYFVRF